MHCHSYFYVLLYRQGIQSLLPKMIRTVVYFKMHACLCCCLIDLTYI